MTVDVVGACSCHDGIPFACCAHCASAGIGRGSGRGSAQQQAVPACLLAAQLRRPGTTEGCASHCVAEHRAFAGRHQDQPLRCSSFLSWFFTVERFPVLQLQVPRFDTAIGLCSRCEVLQHSARAFAAVLRFVKFQHVRHPSLLCGDGVLNQSHTVGVLSL